MTTGIDQAVNAPRPMVAPLGAHPKSQRGALLTDAVRSRPRVMAAVLASIFLLSLLDAALTTLELHFGLAFEANPILHALFSIHPSVALLFKLTMTVLVIASMWRGRDSRLIVRIALATFLGYGALIAYHLGSLTGMGVL